MLGLKSTASAARYCQCHDELRLPVPDAPTCSCFDAALAAHAEDGDCPPYSGNRLRGSPSRANSSSRQALGRQNYVRVVLISGLPADRAGQRLDPHDQYLLKPVSSRRLLRTIDEVGAGGLKSEEVWT